MDSQDTNSKTSEHSEEGSQIIIISEPAKDYDDKPIFDDIIEPSNSTVRSLTAVWLIADKDDRLY